MFGIWGDEKHITGLLNRNSLTDLLENHGRFDFSTDRSWSLKRCWVQWDFIEASSRVTLKYYSENIMSLSPLLCFSGVVILWLWQIQSIANNNPHSHQGFLYKFPRKIGCFKLAGLYVKVKGIVYLKIGIIYCHFMDIFSNIWWHTKTHDEAH